LVASCVVSWATKLALAFFSIFLSFLSLFVFVISFKKEEEDEQVFTTMTRRSTREEEEVTVVLGGRALLRVGVDLPLPL